MQPLRVSALAGVGLLLVVGCAGKASSTGATGGMDTGGAGGVPTAGTAGAAGITHTGGAGGVAGAGGITYVGGSGGVAGAGGITYVGGSGGVAGAGGITYVGGSGGAGGITHVGGSGGVANAPVDASGCPLFPVQAEGAACVAPTRACGAPPHCTGVNAPNHIVSGSVIKCVAGRWVRDQTERICDCNAPELRDTAECGGGSGAGGQGGD